MRFKIKALSALLLFIVLSGHSFGSNYTTEAPVKIIGISEAQFSKGEIRAALQLTYETKLQMDDEHGLRKEAENIWKTFKIEVENGGYNAAILFAQAPPIVKNLFESEGEAYGFLIVKEPSGNWVFFGDK